MTTDSVAASYLLLIYGSSLGVFQMAAAAATLRGLWFFRNRTLTYAGGIVMAGGTLTWFFGTVDIHLPHAAVQGAQQLGLFLLGAFCALLSTFLLSSLVNHRGVARADFCQAGEGIEEFKGKTVYESIAARLRNRGRAR